MLIWAGHYRTDTGFLKALVPLMGFEVTVSMQITNPAHGGLPAAHKWVNPRRRLSSPQATTTGLLAVVDIEGGNIIIVKDARRYRIKVSVISKVQREDVMMGGVHASNHSSDQDFIKYVRPLVGRVVEVGIGRGTAFDRWDRSARHREPIIKIHGTLQEILNGHRFIVIITASGDRHRLSVPTISYVADVENLKRHNPWEGRDKK